MEWWLPLVWFGVIAFAVLMYVLLDGFDLGVGILFPLAPSSAGRDVMMNAVAPVWDGNETWLVLGGGGLFVAFPVVYATALPALYLPLMLMLIALIFRGVAFEFRSWSARSASEGEAAVRERSKANTHRRLWSGSFFAGSLFAAFAQGVILGAVVQGIEVEQKVFVGGVLDWLSPFALFTGVSVVVGYALLGTGWLIIKTEGPLQAWCYRLVRPLTVAMLVAIAGVSVWTPLMNQAVAERWFNWPNILWFSPVPLVTLGLGYRLWRAEGGSGPDGAPFLLTLGLFALSYLGLAISLWPNILPPGLTVWEAASAPSTQLFMLVGVLLLIPLVLVYTAWSYYVFRGKVRAEEGYH